MNFPALIFMLVVSLAGGFGAVVRMMAARFTGVLPWGILLVNGIGSLVIGFGWVMQQLGTSNVALGLLAVILMSGFAGGLTTFSSWAAQTAEFVVERKTKLALWNTALNLLTSVAAVVVGMIAGSLLLK
ncbi:MAG: hypothetical protein RL556_238 [Actinomycetota bacterium]|jgi:CrcB protein